MSASKPADKIGIIGGSGVYEISGLREAGWKRVTTPFGDPSDEILTGILEDRPIAFLPRHGRGHRFGRSSRSAFGAC